MALNLHSTTFLLAINFVFGSNGDVLDYTRILDTCCQYGSRNLSNNCEIKGDEIEIFLKRHPENEYECRASFEICCIREQKNENCRKGKERAMSGKDCPSFTQKAKRESIEIESYIGCCHTCALGIRMAKQDLNCNLNSLPYSGHLAESYSECCKSSKLKSNKTSPTACQIKNPCEQICEDFNSSEKIECRCKPGFRLGEDEISCNDIDECWEGIDRCPVGQNCVNQQGSYTCTDNKQNQNTSAPSINEECPPGFKSSPQNSSFCVDIDECAERVHRCVEGEEYCDNFRGGYRCVQYDTGIIDNKCPPGHNWIETKCEDVDECTSNTHQCNTSTEICVNSIGSYSCFPNRPLGSHLCDPGFRLNPKTQECEDINECDTPNACMPNQRCENIPGAFRCYCRIGFTLDMSSGQCVDINECQLNLHNCDEFQRCDNTIGSFYCARELHCGTGYTYNSDRGICEDDDECALGTHNCIDGFDCLNVQGSFRCNPAPCPDGEVRLQSGNCANTSCGTGLRFDRRTETCIDINECQKNPCRKYETCHNTFGSYRCIPNVKCDVGFQLNKEGDACEDIDECETGAHTCNAGQNCRNTQGSYFCECISGFIKNRDGQCEDIDECALPNLNSCKSKNAKCENLPGSYRCFCNSGFHADENGMCVDTDECRDIPNLCSHICRNTYGSFQCQCERGYELQEDGRSCQDIDECQQSNKSASFFRKFKRCVGICRNTPGSYKCDCPPGYRISPDGHSCIDINECEEYKVCNGPDDSCLNTKGSYKCYTLDCPKGYVKDLNHKNRCMKPIRSDGNADLSTPMWYSYSYLAMPSNLPIPPSGHLDLITVRGPLFKFARTSFKFKVDWAQTRLGVSQVDQNFFTIRDTGFNEAKLMLLKSIEGPQEVKLDLDIDLYNRGLFGGKTRAIIFIVVSEYDY
ncbi:hypothetical protein B4U79_08827 [Dinothrombium tinctorium]|uniref:Fibulin-1-like protein n=1 Tax=Dinothrombium tinctorium TaxID=1965070 RepID=A0A443QV85_9ACAR|nr:hypothetical protein B4U79_08827 [Dinothrombium tinctorium]